VIRDLHRLGAAAEPLLVRATTDSEHWTRAIAAEQILRLPAATPKALAAVVALLDDKDPLVRSEVLQDLLWSLHPAPGQEPKHAALAREQVLRLLTSEDPHVRTTCAEAQWQALARRVERDITDHLPYGAFSTLMYEWGIQKRKGTDAEVFRDATSMAAWALTFATDARAEIRAAAAQVLGQLPSSPASREALTLLVADADLRVRLAAVTALGWHGQQARSCLGALGKAFHDRDWFVRAAAATALRRVHTR
jgi:HEAT repeat protein